jgi:pimeloyl-ACP methyl ester carboxylesterase
MSSRSSPVDGFRLAFDRFGIRGAPAVVLLHGWPGNRHDYRLVVPMLGDVADVIVPDLRGFGGSDKHAVAVQHFYSATAQAASVVGLIRELGLADVVVAGYDVGSRVAQSVARMHPELVQALVLSPAARRWPPRADRARAGRVLVSGVSPATRGRPADRW